MAVTKEKVKELLQANDAVICHFTGEGQGVLGGIKEYICIVDDEEELEEGILDPAPGFELVKAVPIDCDDLGPLPCNVNLVAGPW
jgi:hypothetical protein